MIMCIFTFICVGVSIAGQGGFVYLINLSGSDWKRTHRELNNMNSWTFPNLLKNGFTDHVYVEFPHSQRVNPPGLAQYKLVGTRKSFQISAHGKPPRLEAVYTNVKIDGQPKGMRRNLGWRHDGDTNFIIIGNNGKYTGTSLDGSNWMKNNINMLGSRTLRQISIPGAHNAGMSRLDGRTAFVRKCNAVTQSHPVRDQLNLGIRYFDIRPVIGKGGDFLTGHYTHILEIWMGGNGQSISSIIKDLNVFTKNHNELIIIKLSHSLNTDVGFNKYRKFNQYDWDRLFQKLDAINFLYNDSNSNVLLEQVTVDEFTNHGSKSSIVIIVDDPVELGSRLGKGYFKPYNLDIYDNYANTNNWAKMINDQIKKMHEHSNKKYFLLSWTLTQSGQQAALCHPTLKNLAHEANIRLGNLLYREISSSSYPNIILVDYVEDTDVAAMALAITTKIM